MKIPARYTFFLVALLLLVGLHELLLQVMADQHIAHVLLASGRCASSAAPALVAALFVAVRVVVVVLVPALVLFVAVRVVFHAVRRRADERETPGASAKEALAHGGGSD
jgi:NADH:ubiquinone oxidoreductase subunit 5 (subunit L)/multisubunit Na+/H+ antiporter MnhA subunit